jgi:hypothetical protein
MRAAGPAARPPHATLKLGKRFFDANISGLSFLSRGHPAYPLVPCERCNIFPQRIY